MGRKIPAAISKLSIEAVNTLQNVINGQFHFRMTVIKLNFNVHICTKIFLYQERSKLYMAVYIHVLYTHGHTHTHTRTVFPCYPQGEHSQTQLFHFAGAFFTSWATREIFVKRILIKIKPYLILALILFSASGFTKVFRVNSLVE